MWVQNGSLSCGIISQRFQNFDKDQDISYSFMCCIGIYSPWRKVDLIWCCHTGQWQKLTNPSDHYHEDVRIHQLIHLSATRKELPQGMSSVTYCAQMANCWLELWRPKLNQGGILTLTDCLCLSFYIRPKRRGINQHCWKSRKSQDVWLHPNSLL